MRVAYGPQSAVSSGRGSRAGRARQLAVGETDLPGVVIVEPDVFRDPRGFFLETFHAARYRDGGSLRTPP